MERRAIIIADLGYGDAGKGSVVDYLARSLPVHTVVRYNGGAQAAHHVVADGREHCFAQFGSGTLAGANTYLSEHMLVNPLNLLSEAEHLQEIGVTSPLRMLSISDRAPIITPFQKSVNRIREFVRREDRHGSCGEGVGEAASDIANMHDDVLRAGDLHSFGTTRRKLRSIRDRKREELRGMGFSRHSLPIQNDVRAFTDPNIIEALVERYAYVAAQVDISGYDWLRHLLDADGTLVFEGAQGVLLDEEYGFHPYTTWSKTTFQNATAMLADYQGRIERVGLLRAYAIRHGPGPFVTEDAALQLPEAHNRTNEWQREVRVGYFDAVAARYALEVCGGADWVGLTCLDRLAEMPAVPLVATAYRHAEANAPITRLPVTRCPPLAVQEALGRWLDECTPIYAEVAGDYEDKVQRALTAPIRLLSRGPGANDKEMR